MFNRTAFAAAASALCLLATVGAQAQSRTAVPLYIVEADADGDRVVTKAEFEAFARRNVRIANQRNPQTAAALRKGLGLPASGRVSEAQLGAAIQKALGAGAGKDRNVDALIAGLKASPGTQAAVVALILARVNDSPAVSTRAMDVWMALWSDHSRNGVVRI